MRNTIIYYPGDGKVSYTTKRKETMPPKKKAQTKAPVMTLKVLRRVKLGDNREVRIMRIPTGFGENLIRIGINTLPDGDNMSGAVFPESQLPAVIDALQGAAGAASA